MKKFLSLLILTFTLSTVGPALSQSQSDIIIDGSQTIELGGLSLSNGTLEAGSLTITGVERLEIGKAGVRVFKNGTEAMFFPSDENSRSSKTLKEGLLQLDEAMGYEEE